MERVRKPFQGVANIIRFNWHFYVLSIFAILLLLVIVSITHSWYTFYIKILIAAILATTIISLAVSFYVYDLSNLYSLNWLHQSTIHPTGKMVNINAGFDETSTILQTTFLDAELIVFDFYDPQKHTEISIKRARKAYPPFPGTKTINTASLPLPNNSVSAIFLMLSAHEIRIEKERIVFFKEISRALKPSGKIIVTEHLRNLPNFLAYNVGFFHFHSKTTWFRTFQQTGLHVQNQIKITPFITTFILTKNGTTS